MNQEVKLNADERALLDWIQARIKPDGCFAVSDTALLEALQMKEDPSRFFAAKNRLRDAGVLACYIDGANHQVFQLLMPERPHPKSRRYVFTLVPLELIKEVRSWIKKKRLEEMTAPAAPKKPREAQQPKRDFARAQAGGQQRLGVSPAPKPAGPPRPAYAPTGQKPRGPHPHSQPSRPNPARPLQQQPSQQQPSGSGRPGQPLRPPVSGRS